MHALEKLGRVLKLFELHEVETRQGKIALENRYCLFISWTLFYRWYGRSSLVHRLAGAIAFGLLALCLLTHSSAVAG
jgi:hypothetical protein